jgi:hypothetical protein
MKIYYDVESDEILIIETIKRKVLITSDWGWYLVDSYYFVEKVLTELFYIGELE